MAGLEKFEASESWRSNFKKFLFIERKPTVKKTETTSETQRYSLDIGKDLQTLLNDRKKQMEIEKQRSAGNQEEQSGKENMSYSSPYCDDTLYGLSEQNLPILENVSNESFEALERMCEKTASDPNSTLFRYLNHGEDTQKYGDSPWRKANDESFEALEKMCDKSVSDPNSTLFQYLHSDHKEQVLADAKKRSTDGSAGDCAKMDFDSRNPLLAKFGDCTLLDDVEAPSRLWENTIAVDAGFRTSPIKMVGLMRPSTIIEEAADESANSDISSQASFQTASTKGVLSDISSAYDSAHESIATSAHTDLSNQRREEEIEIDVDDILMLAIAKSRNKLLSSQMAYIPPRVVITEASDRSNSNVPSDQENTSDDNETSVDLIDLEKTIAVLEFSPHSSVLGGDTVVDIVVIDDDQLEFSEEEVKEEIDEDDEDASVIDILSDEEEDRIDKQYDTKLDDNPKDYSLGDGPCEEDKENYTFDSSSERSIKFNDTMEEVEYLLKKGREYMAAKEDVVATNLENKINPVSEVKMCKAQPNSLMVTAKKETTPIASSYSKAKLPSSSTFIKTPNKNIPASSDRYALDMRPFPKLDIFGRSQPTAGGHPRQKALTNKQQFAHIVSPIGTYMKKTASTPLMSTGKMKNKNANILNSTAFRELEYESRLCQPKNGSNSPFATLPGCSGVHKTLPKKAYISSELKHIVDERTPITIPGGKKIQKYLENAMMPAVLRHDGKMKIPGGIRTNSGTMDAPALKTPLKNTNSDVKYGLTSASASMTLHRNNASLADLSVMSGDVSMYTIMDAQKF